MNWKRIIIQRLVDYHHWIIILWARKKKINSICARFILLLLLFNLWKLCITKNEKERERTKSEIGWWVIEIENFRKKIFFLYQNHLYRWYHFGSIEKHDRIKMTNDCVCYDNLEFMLFFFLLATGIHQ